MSAGEVVLSPRIPGNPLLLRTNPICSRQASSLIHFPRQSKPLSLGISYFKIVALKRSNPSKNHRKPPKNLRYPRRAKAPPPDTRMHRVPLKKEKIGGNERLHNFKQEEQFESSSSEGEDDDSGANDSTNTDSIWTEDELEAISSLFERGAPKNSRKPQAQRKKPLPLTNSYKSRPPGLPTPKHHIRLSMRQALLSRSPLTAHVYKNPDILIGIAKEIGGLPADIDVSEVLERWGGFLRKGSLSMTIRELGHMGLPERALQTFCWAQKHRPAFFPDDKILASTVEVLASNGQLKMEHQLNEYLSSASRTVMEAMARGFIRAGNLNLARKLLLFAKDNGRTLDPSIHAKLILEAGKNPDKYRLVEVLLDELGEREDFDLKPHDCSAIMKVCIRLGKYEAVENLFTWFNESGRSPSVVMYTTVIHGRYCAQKYREALAAVWEMEESNILLDLPAYRVVIRLCVALDDLSRAVRYFSRLKEAGFTPTYDIYRDMIKAYAVSGRLAKCRQICKEMEMAGFKLDNGMATFLLQMKLDISSPNKSYSMHQ